MSLQICLCNGLKNSLKTSSTADMNAVKKFVEQWSGHGYEKGATQSFWLALLRDLVDISDPERFIRFEVPVKLKHTTRS